MDNMDDVPVKVVASTFHERSHQQLVQSFGRNTFRAAPGVLEWAAIGDPAS